jgi:hypothetical protein
MERCYYYPEKECRWGCARLCDGGWDFVAGASPCHRPLWLTYGSIIVTIGVALLVFL